MPVNERLTGNLTVDGTITQGGSAVQQQLVSGTNIKTINGSSVLGSGDLAVSSSKAGGLYALLPPISGSVVCNRLFGSAFGSQTYGNNLISLMPFIPANTFTCSDISLIVSVNGSGTPQGRILIYSNGTTGAYINRPYNKLFESANLDFSTTGAKTALLSMTFTAGETYWIGFQNSFTTTSAALSSIGTTSLAYIIPVAATASINSVVTNSSFTFGSAPATMTTGATLTNANVAYMLFTIA